MHFKNLLSLLTVSHFYDIISKIPIAISSLLGVGLGLGGQSLIKDIINGIFILFEDEYNIDDFITIGSFSGIVKNMGLKTTILEDFNGDLHYIPNGSISEITNHSKQNSRFLVDLEIAYEENIEFILDILKKECENFMISYEKNIIKSINVLGINAFNSSSVTIRIIGFAKPLYHWEVERSLRKHLKICLSKNSIEIPYQKTVILNK